VAPDLPAGTRAARDLLLKDPVRLTEADRDSLHRFFRERIQQAKAASTAASWEQQLEQVFDYTAWHQFVVKIDRSSGTDRTRQHRGDRSRMRGGSPRQRHRRSRRGQGGRHREAQAARPAGHQHLQR
jgi:hypothetical protein